MADMEKLIKMMGTKKATMMVNRFPAVAEYLSLHYEINEEEDIYKFNIASNDAVLTSSGKGEYRCHLASHIAQDGRWAANKLYHCGVDGTGTSTPSWFNSEEELSDLMEKLFFTKDLSGLEKWVNDRDIYYNSNRNRYSVEFTQESETGKFMRSGSSATFPCHGVRFVFEYTEFHEDGEFALLTAYPVPTEQDKLIAFKK